MSDSIEPTTAATNGNGDRMESFVYDDKIVRMFMLATFIWGVVAFLVGVIVAVQLAFPQTNYGPWLTFGRLRPLHTNAAIFAFAGNGVFTAVYYSTQRLCKARMFSDLLSRLHFWGWQGIIVSAALTLPLGITTGKEYAELEWPIDIAIAVVWAGFFGVNFFGTLIKRRERHMYVALWFYIASIVAISMLHIFNSLAVPASLFKSYPVYAGVQDAFIQWWYGHNAVAFFLTTPFLGMMYYFLPKAANRPVYSYRLSIIHFWSLVFIYIWAGPHHLHYTALPMWASTLGMVFSIMLWMPSWGGMINGLLTLRGAWNKVTTDPVLKFFVVGVTFYGMSTFEGPMLSIKTVNALSHYTDWTIAHVHAGTLGWNGFMIFGMTYWLLPRLFQTDLYSKKLATAHFWIGTIGILLYVMSIYTAGITQGLMWRAFDQNGSLAYPDFVETTLQLMPMYWIRIFGGALYLGGMVLLGVNFFMTWKNRPKQYEDTVHQAPALKKEYKDPPLPKSRLNANTDLGHKGDVWLRGDWHRRWERLPIRFTVWVTIAVVVASLFEAIPMFLVRSNVPTIASVQPYTPLELEGRDVYIAEGCYNCHSQMIRPMRAETVRYGEYSKPGEFVYDHPFQWGSRRIGPDLARIGGKYSHFWHYDHLMNPAFVVAGSIMPKYNWMENAKVNFEGIQSKINAMAMLGVPYGDAINNAPEMAREQAKLIADELAVQANDPALAEIWDSKMIALIAYLQRVGVDISKPAPEADATGEE